MLRTRNCLLAPALCLTLSLVGFTALAVAKRKLETPGMSGRQRVLHALNRFTFGPRPGDIDRVSQQGIDQWFEQQLHPEKINDSALEARLAPLRTLRMDTGEIVENFPPPKLLKAIMDGREPMPRDPAKRAIYEAETARYQEKLDRKDEERKTEDRKSDERKNDGKNNEDGKNEATATDRASSQTVNAPETTAGSKLSEEERARRREAKLYADIKAEELLDMPPDQRMKEILKMPPDEQRALLNPRADKREEVLASMSPQQRETAMALVNPQQVVQSELMQAKLLRATYGERQLEEVMADFWFNHFNVFGGKGADRYLITSYERDVIRPNALGKFEDLLVATAKNPAMLFYLDNWLSVGPDSDEALGLRRDAGNRGWGRRRRGRFPTTRYPENQRPAKRKANRDGLNENYGRELMELHTLGVNGGYTQRDVTEVARVFTGWTIREPRKGGNYSFEARRHEPGEKIVLGKKIKEHGEKEGLEVLHLLAHHPSTAKFISLKLAQRFVSDRPPQPLVDRMAETFLKKNGDIREVLRTMYKSPEFWAPEAYRAKVKTPLEFVVSALRATDAEIQDPAPLIGALQNMGMPLYGAQPPTGYSMKAETWVNSSALLGRMNFALALANDKLKGVKAGMGGVLGAAAPADAHQILTSLEHAYLDDGVSEQTHRAILKQLDDPQITRRKLDDSARPPNIGAIAGLILGSPEFQKR